MSATADAVASRRVGALARELAERELDALLVQSLVDVRYLTGFTGSNGLALVRARDVHGEHGETAAGDADPREGDGDDDGDAREGEHVFLTDFRYTSQSAAQVPSLFRREIVAGETLDGLAEALRGGAAASDGGAGTGAVARLGFDERSITVEQHRRLAESLPDGWELVACAGLVSDLRLAKDAGEVERMRAAAKIADEALQRVLEAGLAGRSEREVAIDLELQMRRLGAEAASFASIVAAGPHGALPHAEPRAQEIARDVLVTIDWGALHDGYCSDCTRTYATGEGIGARAREVYAVVLEAQEAGLDALSAGRSGREVDAVARAVIERAGFGDHFGHGLGHGVGLEIHEGPRLSRTAGEEPLPAGCVVTVEPGVYLPGELGVRIEDLVVVGESGQEILTRLPKTLTVVS